MKILVAGGAGYIGSRLVPELLNHNYEVRVVDLLWFGNHLPLAVDLVEKDVLDLTESDLAGFDQVIFLAGLSNDPMAEFSPAMNFISNASAPAYLAYLSKKCGVKRFIYADSCSVYGYAMDKLYDEESPVQSNYPYGISKLQGEQGVMQLEDDGFSVICLRQGTVSGFSPRMRFDLIVNTMYMTAISEKVITVNNPSIWRPILDIGDAVMGYIRAIQVDQSISGVFNLASGNYTVGQVADSVRNFFEKRSPGEVRLDILKNRDFRNYKVSTEKGSIVLGVRFHGSVESILRDLEANCGRDYPFEADNHYNIRVFKELIKE
tara:strand:+ start:2564 stop:3523 length:960 start_codon:yes stop_codon:yes gene_type:complete